MDGDVAPVDRIVKLAKKYNLMTMVDDAMPQEFWEKREGGRRSTLALKMLLI